ncbi:outer membrane protein assembly factor BamB family protein [Geodermatophilus amargosae]|uniref:outer membrane protein assembly factor BamB family protein n=1 Tax=Geodermatophilus amargosae TaxID=1296565 RepID=UPI0034DE5A72
MTTLTPPSREACTRRYATAATAAALLLALTGCGSDVAGQVSAAEGAGDGPRRSGTMDGAVADASSTPSTTPWTSDLLLAGSPLAVEDRIVVPVRDAGGTAFDLAAVAPDSGEVVWQVDVPLPDNATDADVHGLSLGSAAEGTAVILSYEASRSASGLDAGGSALRAAAFDAGTGELLWDIEAPGELMYDFMLDEGNAQIADIPAAAHPVIVFIPTLDMVEPDDGEVALRATGVDATTGQSLWQYQGAGEIQWWTGDVLVAEEAAPRGNSTWLTGLDRNTGAVTWQAPAPAGETYQFNWYIVDVRDGAVLARRATNERLTSDTVYEAFLLNATTGQVVGAPAAVGPLSSTGRIAPSGDAAYLITPGEELRALSAASGWTIPLPPSGEQGVRGFDADGNIIVSSNGLVTVDAQTGQQVGTVTTDPGVSEPVLGSRPGEYQFTVGDWEIFTGTQDNTLSGQYADS